ncbi:MAG: sigma-54-dependent Fis family transcriptional regulator, partial [Gammaproteobacteria bacterium]|nr:sigma-54-dependent Fis family transcriptional regulator [Gammaproteobacteria bacterium]
MSRPIALIIDDEPDIRELLEITLGRMKIETRAAADLREAKQFLASERFDLCLTDMRLPDGDGLDLVKLIGKKYPDLPVAVITAHGNMNSAVESLKAGAFDFVSKPVDLQILRNLVKSALKLESDSRPEERSSSNENQAEKLLGKSPVTKQIGSMIQKLARSQAPVYVSGESGTGKELAARLIHAQGPKSKAPFIAVNCGAIPQELVESEFFGHKKGSFTGAVDDKQGLFQAAQGGTLFLDEVADLPLQMQVKLLRSIQEKRVRPVGAAEEHPVDVRIISATHKDLGHMVEQGTFRQDPFYRINVIELRIPPLRERQDDIPVLTDSIL